MEHRWKLLPILKNFIGNFSKSDRSLRNRKIYKSLDIYEVTQRKVASSFPTKSLMSRYLSDTKAFCSCAWFCPAKLGREVRRGVCSLSPSSSEGVESFKDNDFTVRQCTQSDLPLIMIINQWWWSDEMRLLVSQRNINHPAHGPRSATNAVPQRLPVTRSYKKQTEEDDEPIHRSQRSDAARSVPTFWSRDHHSKANVTMSHVKLHSANLPIAFVLCKSFVRQACNFSASYAVNLTKIYESSYWVFCWQFQLQ